LGAKGIAMIKKLLTTILFLSFFAGNIAMCQTSKLDLLRQDLASAKHDTTRCSILIKIGDAYSDAKNDSAIFYYNQSIQLAQLKKFTKHQALALRLSGLYYTDQGAFDKAMEHFSLSIENYKSIGELEGVSRNFHSMGVLYRMQSNYEKAIESYLKSYKFDEESENKNGMAMNLNNLGIVYRAMGNYEKAIQYHQRSLRIKEEMGDLKGVASSYGNIGVIYRNLGYYDKAIEQYLMAIKIFEDLDDNDGIAKCYNNIGTIQFNQGNNDKALEYYYKSLKICEALKDEKGVARGYNNIGTIKRLQKDFSTAIEYFQKSFAIWEKLGDKEMMAHSFSNIGNLYQNQGNYPKAIEQHKIATTIREEIGDKKGLVNSYCSIADLYKILADSSYGAERSKYLQEALVLGKKAYHLAIDLKAAPLLKNAAENLMKTYSLLGRYTDALLMSDVLLIARDSMFNEEKTMALTEMQTKYETDKKQKEIEKQEIIIEQQELDNHRQYMLRNFSITASVLLVLLVLAAVRGIYQKRTDNNIILQKNALLQQAYEEILATSEALSAQNEELILRNQKIAKQQEEIEIQKNSLADLAMEIQEINKDLENKKGLLATKNKEITDSLTYGQRIQNAVLPSTHSIKPFFNDYYIFHKPKTIVSGDFYWAAKVRELIIFCVADCTGHGVPGALMSMLGVAFLNEIVRKEEIVNSAKLLNELREYVINSMKKEGAGVINNEGMDVGLCVYSTQNRKLQFSGANVPCWIIPKKIAETNTSNGLIELAPCSMPIGYSNRMEPFKLIEYEMNKGDRIYISTDGIADQSEKRKPNKSQVIGFKDLIVSTNKSSLNEQKKSIEHHFANWLQKNEQIDDVTLLCLEV
jgi:tetratricopeptide (TPR) repeat protein/serine phosphatase RsbU (regulator of sigma subunit)